MALRSPESYGFPAESLNMTSFSPHHFQSSTVDIAHAQRARTGREEINSNNVRDDSRQQRYTVVNKRKRRKRTIFTCEQLSRLESEFADQQYMVGAERQQLAEALNLFAQCFCGHHYLPSSRINRFVIDVVAQCATAVSVMTRGILDMSHHAPL